nr:hypothetical protein CFP56_50669 [Quercus suber]
MIQNLETTLKAGAVPQVPQFRPAMAQPLQPVTTAKSEAPSKSEEDNEKCSPSCCQSCRRATEISSQWGCRRPSWECSEQGAGGDPQ